MTDRELLEKAAKAADITLRWCKHEDGDEWCFIPKHLPPHNRRQYDDERGTVWDPLEDDGDALRLAVKTNLDVDVSDGTAWAFNGLPGAAGTYEIADAAQDIYAATRRAIVRAAAEIGGQQ